MDLWTVWENTTEDVSSVKHTDASKTNKTRGVPLQSNTVFISTIILPSFSLSYSLVVYSAFCPFNPASQQCTIQDSPSSRCILILKSVSFCTILRDNIFVSAGLLEIFLNPIIFQIFTHNFSREKVVGIQDEVIIKLFRL